MSSLYCFFLLNCIFKFLIVISLNLMFLFPKHLFKFSALSVCVFSHFLEFAGGVYELLTSRPWGLNRSFPLQNIFIGLVCLERIFNLSYCSCLNGKLPISLGHLNTLSLAGGCLGGIRRCDLARGSMSLAVALGGFMGYIPFKIASSDCGL